MQGAKRECAQLDGSMRQVLEPEPCSPTRPLHATQGPASPAAAYCPPTACCCFCSPWSRSLRQADSSSMRDPALMRLRTSTGMSMPARRIPTWVLPTWVLCQRLQHQPCSEFPPVSERRGFVLIAEGPCPELRACQRPPVQVVRWLLLATTARHSHLHLCAPR